MSNKLAVLIFFLVILLSGCSRKAETAGDAVPPAGTMTPYVSEDISLMPTPTTLPTLAPTPTTLPTLMPTPTTLPTLAPTTTPSPTPVSMLAEDEVCLCAKNFPDKAFRELISALVDHDKNGILTLAERESLTELRNSNYDMEHPENEYYYVHEPETEEEEIMYYWLNRVISLEGIQYFPKLRLVIVDESWQRDEYFGEEQMNYLENFRVENMPELESVQLITRTKNVEIKNAPKLRYFYLRPEVSVETCTVTIEDCDALEAFEYYSGATPVFRCTVPNLKKLCLRISENNFMEQLWNIFDFTELEDLSLYISNAQNDIVLKDLLHLKDLQIGCNTGVVLSNLNDLERVTLSGISGLKVEDCENVTSLWIENTDTLKSLNLEDLKKLEYLHCQNSSIKSLKLGTPYTNVYIPGTDIYMAFAEEVEMLAQRTAAVGNKLTADVAYKSVFYSGVTVCDCTGKVGYEIDLNGDGIVEQLYSDKTGFYINGVNQGIARLNYEYDDTIWNRFWLVDVDEADNRINLILNAESQEYRQYAYFDPEKESRDKIYQCFGQYLAFYDEGLQLIGWAEVQPNSLYYPATKSPFSDAVYDGIGGVRFNLPYGEQFDFRGIRNGILFKNEQMIELAVAEDGMLEVPGKKMDAK